MPRTVARMCLLAGLVAAALHTPVALADDSDETNPVCFWGGTSGPTLGNHVVGQTCFYGVYPWPTYCDHDEDVKEVWIGSSDRIYLYTCHPVP